MCTEWSSPRVYIAGYITDTPHVSVGSWGFTAASRPLVSILCPVGNRNLAPLRYRCITSFVFLLNDRTGKFDRRGSVVQLCPTLCDPKDCSTPGLPAHHQLPALAQTPVCRVGDAIQPESVGLVVCPKTYRRGIFSGQESNAAQLGALTAVSHDNCQQRVRPIATSSEGSTRGGLLGAC